MSSARDQKAYDERLKKLNQVIIKEVSNIIGDMKNQLTDTKKQLTKSEEKLKESNKTNKLLDEKLVKKEKKIKNQSKELVQKSEQLEKQEKAIAEQSKQLTEKDVQITNQSEILNEKDEQITKYLKERNTLIKPALEIVLKQRDRSPSIDDVYNKLIPSIATPPSTKKRKVSKSNTSNHFEDRITKNP